MPEYPEYQAFAHHVRTFAAQYKRTHAGAAPTGYVQLVPRTFALGTTRRPYVTCTVDTSAYTGSTDLPNDIQLHEHDVRRAVGQPYAYLLRPQQPHEVFVAVRGKQIAFAMGRDCYSIHLGLEGHIHPVTPEQWEQILAQDVEGPNEDEDRAEKMRQFRVPPHLIPAGTSKVMDRRVTVLMALHYGDLVWLLIDFARLVRIRVISDDSPWTEDDMVPGGPIWQFYGDGPDLNLEPERFLKNLDAYRLRIQAGFESRKWSQAPIVEWLCGRGDICNGIGRHLSIDFVHFCGLAPNTPAFRVFKYHYDDFRHLLIEYMAQWVSDRYKKDCCGLVNSSALFAWNRTSNRKYRQAYLLVFRKAEATVAVDVYNRHARNGNLDPDHVLGKPYSEEKAMKFLSSNRERILHVPVYHMEDKSINAYTIVVAKSPVRWFDAVKGKLRLAKDVIECGRASKVGVSEFNAMNQNMPDPDEAILERSRGGRRKVEKTGRRGRPAKAPRIADLRKLEKPVPQRILEARQAEAEAEKAKKAAQAQVAASQPVQTLITAFLRPRDEPDSESDWVYNESDCDDEESDTDAMPLRCNGNKRKGVTQGLKEKKSRTIKKHRIV
ncbi:uncharacterized protein B0H18DRAFT_915084 [Fomitopsis serialis]|uniref:uncharacterized protein n=1 Tax=Fomitopsis serialis TaxID=139415 RepID=UPI0020077768|nr:uncharacterized protein B0H18DRAFT_915084 [Neoantrodia serialis]KAH9915222.1 hypothetical protein B0H18DRAFT_915084 [Neoantrodia serialis]